MAQTESVNPHLRTDLANFSEPTRSEQAQWAQAFLDGRFVTANKESDGVDKEAKVMRATPTEDLDPVDGSFVASDDQTATLVTAHCSAEEQTQ